MALMGPNANGQRDLSGPIAPARDTRKMRPRPYGGFPSRKTVRANKYPRYSLAKTFCQRRKDLVDINCVHPIHVMCMSFTCIRVYIYVYFCTNRVYGILDDDRFTELYKV